MFFLKAMLTLTQVVLTVGTQNVIIGIYAESKEGKILTLYISIPCEICNISAIFRAYCRIIKLVLLELLELQNSCFCITGSVKNLRPSVYLLNIR